MSFSGNNNSKTSFMTDSENQISEDFLTSGFITREADDFGALSEIQELIVKLTCEYLSLEVPGNKTEFLDEVHKLIEPGEINNLRLHVFREMNKAKWLREAYYSCARNTLETLIGNELAMQKNINLSIQMPEDSSSILPIHSDVWSGDSQFELVLWIPYVNVIRTKCMFILPAAENDKHLKRIEGSTISSTSGIMAEVEEDLTWVEMRFGEIMIFTQNLMHGNVLNQETTTRWSSNCRFKSLLSPYSDKKLGEFLSQYPYEQPLDLGCIINCQILEATDGKAWISRLHIIPASWFA